jgi:hypothetical protein
MAPVEFYANNTGVAQSMLVFRRAGAGVAVDETTKKPIADAIVTARWSGDWNSRWHALWRWPATLVLLVPLQGCTTEYSAMPIEAWVLDAESNQPRAGSHCGRQPGAGRRTGGRQPAGSHEGDGGAVTDSAGKFSLPAWGPKKVPSYPWVYSNARLKEMDPQLFLFQDEHRYLSLFGAGDVTGALTGFAPGARDKFQNAFQNLQQDPATVVSQLGAMRGLSLSASDTEYQLVRPSSGTASAYPVYFIRGEDGVWRINEM